MPGYGMARVRRSAIYAGIGMAMMATPSAAIDICSGGDRAARRMTCLVDGDTGWEQGVKWRVLDIDTPETFEAACDREKQMGEKAKLRLQSLMSPRRQRSEGSDFRPPRPRKGSSFRRPRRRQGTRERRPCPALAEQGQ